MSKRKFCLDDFNYRNTKFNKFFVSQSHIQEHSFKACFNWLLKPSHTIQTHKATTPLKVRTKLKAFPTSPSQKNTIFPHGNISEVRISIKRDNQKKILAHLKTKIT